MTGTRFVGTLVVTLCSLFVFVSGVDAQRLVLRADRMLDVASGRISQNAVVVIGDDRIVRVGGSVPENVRVVNLGDVTLLPGLMDLHTHLTGQIDAASFTRAVREGPADAALKGAFYGHITLMAGFTTVRDFGGFPGVALSRAQAQGLVSAPRIVPSANALGVTGGHCDVTGFQPGIAEQTWMDGVADGPEEVTKAVRYQIKHGAKVIKTCATAGVLSFEGPVGAQQYSDEELEAMVDEAARHGVKVAAHAHGTDGIIAAVKAGVASIEHGSMLSDEAIALMNQHGTYLVPTTYLVDAIPMDVLPPSIRSKAEYVLPLARASVRRAIEAGVNIAFGTDAAVYPHGDNAKEFGVLVDLGMTPIEAIRTATIYAADLLGVDDRGSIKEGMLADLIAVPGNPLENILVLEDVQFVMLGGKVVKHP